MGRAFTVRSGITKMLQLATPYANDEDVEGSLDTWVKNILNRHPQPKVQWMVQGTVDEDNLEETVEGSPSGNTPASSEASGHPTKIDLSKYDLKEIQKLLVENGLPDELIEMLSPSDMVETALEMGLVIDPSGETDN